MHPNPLTLPTVDGAADRASLLPSVDVPAYVSTRDRIAQLLSTAHAQLLEARDLMASSHMGDLDMIFEPRSHRRHGRAKHVGGFTCHDGLFQFQQYVDAHGWQHLLRETGTGSFMDAGRRSQLRDQLEDGNVPELSLSNAQTTLGTLLRDRGLMMRDGVASLFRSLSWDHKSNLPQRFGRRLVFKSYSPYDRFSIDRIRHLQDLYRFSLLFQGEPHPDDRCSGLLQLLLAQEQIGAQSLSLTHFRLQWFKNGNVHIFFSDAAFVDAMNDLLALSYPNALPAP